MLGSLSKRFIFFSLWQVFLFANSKCKRYFHNRLKPAKLTWTAMYRKQHKKVLVLAVYSYVYPFFLICIRWIQPFYMADISLRWFCGDLRYSTFEAVTSLISNWIIILTDLWHLSFGIPPVGVFSWSLDMFFGCQNLFFLGCISKIRYKVQFGWIYLMAVQ